MQAGRRYTLLQTTRWSLRYILIFVAWSTVPVVLYHVFRFEWIHIPWQPISLIGIAVAFYLGFKNNSSYERLWEARKIWGGIVNTSRSFTVMAREYINDQEAMVPVDATYLDATRKEIVHRHVAWLRALAIEMRKPRDWEHYEKRDVQFREIIGTLHAETKFEQCRSYLDPEEYAYIMSKGNRSSHILSIQTKRLMDLRRSGVVEHFRHLELQNLITEMYTLQGQSERIKNFPFPRQYATVNYFFVVLFITLLPFGMLDVFTGMEQSYWIWFSIPFSTIASWVFWMMEMIGDSSENPFEGLYNDVPITSIVTGIEIDIRQMLDETDLPEPIVPQGEMKILS